MKILAKIKEEGNEEINNYIDDINASFQFEELIKKNHPLIEIMRLRKEDMNNSVSLLLAKKFIENGISLENIYINEKNTMNALHFSATILDNNMAKLLLNYMSDKINEKTSDGQTPLSLAIDQHTYSGKKPHPILGRLLKAGATIEEESAKKSFTKMYSFHTQEKNLRKWNEWLLDNNINPYIKLDYGNTVFHYMAKKKYLDPLLYLWKKGFIDIDIKNDSGQTVREKFEYNSHGKVFLLNHIKIEKKMLEESINSRPQTSILKRI